MRFEGNKVLVLGAGKSGLAAAQLLRANGADVSVADAKAKSDISNQETFKAIGVELIEGYRDESSAELCARFDWMVISPGIPAGFVLQQKELEGLKVVSEIELASSLVHGTLVAITGTNGKSTVTTLAGAMLARSFPTFIGGNLGEPATRNPSHESQKHDDAKCVWELSSFQLERCFSMHANVAALLNISDDHLDRHGTLAEYAAAKARVFLNQKKSDTAIAYAGDELVLSIARASGGTLQSFGENEIDAAQITPAALLVPDFGLRLDWREFKLSGHHNRLNAAAASLCALHAGAKVDDVGSELREFSGLPHRMRLVGELNGVRYFNDSKATNVGAAVASLAGLKTERGRVVLIAGGVDKGGSYEPLCQALRMATAWEPSLARAVVLVGQSAPLIRSACKDFDIPTLDAATLESAIDMAKELAASGDSVVLAPACASFDMFRSYAHRGEVFETAVRSLIATHGGGQ